MEHLDGIIILILCIGTILFSYICTCEFPSLKLIKLYKSNHKKRKKHKRFKLRSFGNDSEITTLNKEKMRFEPNSNIFQRLYAKKMKK